MVSNYHFENECNCCICHLILCNNIFHFWQSEIVKNEKIMAHFTSVLPYYFSRTENIKSNRALCIVHKCTMNNILTALHAPKY